METYKTDHNDSDSTDREFCTQYFTRHTLLEISRLYAQLSVDRNWTDVSMPRESIGWYITAKQVR